MSKKHNTHFHIRAKRVCITHAGPGSIASIERLPGGGGLRAALAGPGGGALEADVIMFATGRRPRTEGLGCDAAGVALEAGTGAVVVDEAFQTSAPGVYAVRARIF